MTYPMAQAFAEILHRMTGEHVRIYDQPLQREWIVERWTGSRWVLA